MGIRTVSWSLAAIGVALLATLLVLSALAGTRQASVEPALPQIKHLFTIVLENENYDESFGPGAPSAYLAKTLPGMGVLIPNYFGIGHASLDNYIAMISGQPPNVQTQADCQVFSEMSPGTLNADGVAVGQGCVYPASVKTVANQLEAAGHTWRGYMQDMASGQPETCRHPAVGATDETEGARPADQYATRHDPFVYFHSIIDSPACGTNVVDLQALPGDLGSESATPEYSFITPDLCADGHDAPCADGTSPGGYAGIDAFLREWIPRIEASPAYQDRGAILVIFDESGSGAESCCGETTGPNTRDNGGGGGPGGGGGKTGAVMVSPCVEPGTVSSADYNHYSYLRWVEDNFGLGHLGNAAPQGVGSFGTDVLSRMDCSQGAHLSVQPRQATAGQRTTFRFRLLAELPLCREETTIRFAGRVLTTDANGEASARLRLRGQGRRIAAAVPEICDPATATVWVKRRPGSRASVGIEGAAPVG
jgi:hypothetical protein